jgi:hypothetical protein
MRAKHSAVLGKAALALVVSSTFCSVSEAKGYSSQPQEDKYKQRIDNRLSQLEARQTRLQAEIAGQIQKLRADLDETKAQHLVRTSGDAAK